VNSVPDNIQGTIRHRLAGVRRRLRGSELLSGFLLVLLAALLLSFALVLLELLFRFESPVRRMLLWGGVTVIGILSAWLLGRPLLKLLGFLTAESDEEIASVIGASFPQIKDHLRNGLGLLEERNRGYYSLALLEAALTDLYTLFVPLDLRPVVSYAVASRFLRYLILAALCVLLPTALFHDPLAKSAFRLWHYDESFAVPPPFSLVVEPGNAEVIRGRSMAITVHVVGQVQGEIALLSRREGETEDEARTLERRPDGTFRFEFTDLRSSVLYRARAGEVRSPVYRLTVVDRPMLRVLGVQLHFPEYSGIPPKQLEQNVGDILALKGTRAAFSLESNHELLKASLVFADSSRLPLRVLGSRASGQCVLMKNGSYHVALKDSEGIANADPIEYSIRIQEDAYPTVAVVLPAGNVDVTEKTALPMLFKIADDFGFSRLRLAYRLIQSRSAPVEEHPSYRDLPLPPATGTELLVPFTWVLDSLNLVPEDVVQYYAEVFDNDQVSGPKSALSASYLLRYPSADEVFAEVDQQHERAMEDLQEALKQAEEGKRSLEELKQDLKKEQEKPDWQDRKRAEDLAKKYEDLGKSMKEVSSTVDSMLSRMKKNQLLSPQTLEKYEELQQLLQEMNSPELQEAMKKLQQSLQQLSLDQLKQALQNFSLSEEDFRKSIDRTLSLLKRIQIEQKIDEMIKRAETMASRQEELRHRLERAPSKEQTAATADDQEALSKDATALRRELDALKEKMEQFPGDMPLEETEKARQQLSDGKLEEQLKEVAADVRAMQSERAEEGQRQAEQTLTDVARQMREAKRVMEQNQQRQILNALRRVQKDLLELSRREESLRNSTGGLEQNAPGYREQAEGQMEALQDLSAVLDRLGGLSKKTFSVSPEMGRSLGEAMRQMGGAMQSLDQRNGAAAAQQQTSAMASLNESAMQVQSAINGMMQAGGQGMGMAGFLARLQGLTSQQEGVNRQTQGLTPQQAEAMGRLAAEQGAVRKSLEQLAREASNAGELSKLLGDLQKVAEEMREVQTDLAQGEVNPETLRKQEQIVSRMLDSQRSMRERDFENRRRAESGTNVVRASPRALDLSTQEGKDQLHRDLLRALQEGYAREYEELIRRYFELIQQ
jgi:hypothetical protein